MRLFRIYISNNADYDLKMPNTGEWHSRRMHEELAGTGAARKQPGGCLIIGACLPV
jgi:hypothetical protein